jgi:hypothetical protein
VSSDSGFAAFDDFEIVTSESGMADVPTDIAPPVSFSFSTVVSFAGTPIEDLDSTFTYPARAFWLYRDITIPEPTTFAILASVFCAAIPFRRCR